MSLTYKEVEHIAELARLDLSASEKDQYREQLSAILDYAASLQELDTAGIPPTASVLPARSVLRNDEIGACLDQEELLRNSPRTSAQQFKVPPVME